jgi:hypothetical protein
MVSLLRTPLIDNQDHDEDDHAEQQRCEQMN